MPDNWKEKKGKIGKEFVFNNFKEAISFVDKVVIFNQWLNKFGY